MVIHIGRKERQTGVFTMRLNGEALHVWPPIHEELKVHTYDIIGHMVWQPYWIYNIINWKIFSRTAGQIEGKYHTNVPQALGVQVDKGIIHRSHGLAATLGWRKILNNVFSEIASPIDVKLHSYNLVMMGVHVLNLNLIRRVVWQPEWFKFFDLGSQNAHKTSTATITTPFRLSRTGASQHPWSCWAGCQTSTEKGGRQASTKERWLSNVNEREVGEVNDPQLYLTIRITVQEKPAVTLIKCPVSPKRK